MRKVSGILFPFCIFVIMVIMTVPGPLFVAGRTPTSAYKEKT